MNAVFNLSPSLRLLLVFGFILIFIRKKYPLGVAFISGAVARCLLFGLGPMKTMGIIASAAFLPDTLVLSVMVTAILIFSKSMEQSGPYHHRRWPHAGIYSFFDHAHMGQAH
ncbi:MAG: hypothetical protein KKD44_02570 [Proteobacteria bacterium]|nr:hypothetical protein [Pseudomonadota bacterium]